MSGDQWYWVRSSQTRVDTAQVVQASNVVSWAADSLESARSGVSVMEDWGSMFAKLADPTCPTAALLEEERDRLRSMANTLRFELKTGLTVLLEDVREYAQWLGLAGLIYASADADSAAYFRHCESLNALACVAPRGSSLIGALTSVPAMIKAMERPQLNVGMQVTAMSTENQLRLAGGDPGSTASVSATMARLWLVGGGPALVAPSSVVVTGNGKLAWGTVDSKTNQAYVYNLGNVGPTAKSFDSKWDRIGAEWSSRRWPKGWEKPSHPARLSAALAVTDFAKAPACLPSSTPPKSAAALLQRLEDAPRAKGVGEVQVLRYDNPGSPEPSWSVVIRGTEQWAPGSSNPQDLLSNFQEVAGKMSDQRVAVLAAMELAGIGPGEAVELVGHSQGGAVTLSIAASEEVTAKYNVVSVLTAGGPVGAVPSPTVRVLALENTADIVPALDGRPADSNGNHVVIHFDRSGYPAPTDIGAHSMPTYSIAAEYLAKQAQHDPDLAAFREWEQARLEALRLGDDTHTTHMVFVTSRTLGGVKPPQWELPLDQGSEVGALSGAR